MTIASLINAAPRTTPMPVQPAAQPAAPASGDGRASPFSQLLNRAREPAPAAPQRNGDGEGGGDADTARAADAADGTDAANRSDRALERKVANRGSARLPAARIAAKGTAAPATGTASSATAADGANDDEASAAVPTGDANAALPLSRPAPPIDGSPTLAAVDRSATLAVEAAAAAAGGEADPAAPLPTPAHPATRADPRPGERHRAAGIERSGFDRREAGGDRPAPAALGAAPPTETSAPAAPGPLPPGGGGGGGGDGADGAAALAAAGSTGTAAPAVASSEPATLLSASISAPVTSPEFRAALGVRISVLAQGGVQQAELQLNPAEMGPISVRIAIEGDSARVDFGADVARTRELIEAGWAELATALQDAGFTLSGGGVSQQSQQSPQSQGRGGAGPGGSDRSARDDGIGRFDDPKPQTTVRRNVTIGGIDTFA